MSKEKGMIWITGLEAERRRIATVGTNLVEEMAEFMPSVWPPHKYDEFTAPDGAFIESTQNVDAPSFPGFEMTVPLWTEAGDPYGFAEGEGDKVTLFQNWLFSRRGVEYLADRFGAEPGLFFIPFGARGDRSFEGGKFPRDQWKAGTFDPDLWLTRRNAVATAASYIMQEIDTINSQNVVLSPRSWLINKEVEGPVIGTAFVDTTFTDMPELLSDVSPAWDSFPAYVRVSQFVNPTDPTWTGAAFAFAAAQSLYNQLFLRLSSGAFIQDFFDGCFSVWRTGSQTHRRDQYE